MTSARAESRSVEMRAVYLLTYETSDILCDGLDMVCMMVKSTKAKHTDLRYVVGRL